MKLKFYVTLCYCVMAFFLVRQASAQMKQVTIDQIKLLLQEKESRTMAQKKIGSQLLQASREQRGEKMVAGVNLEPAQVKTSVSGLVKVDMNTDVSDALLLKIVSLGGQVIYPSKEYKTIQAMVPLSKVEMIAGFSEVRFIQPAIESRTVGNPNKNLRTIRDLQKITKKDIASIAERRKSMPMRLAKIKKQVQDYLMILGSGSVNSQGDHSHRADDARNAFGYAGQGIKVGVLSDSYNHLGGAPADVLTDDLPGVGNPFGNLTPVTVLVDYNASTAEDEGRAMLQIVHDLAPKAQLFFASGDVGGAAGFAANIKALRDAGCDIVIDDLGYYNEPCFQDGVVARAVQYVVGSGGMYFSSAGNEGALALGTSGVWEGDFTDAGSPTISTVITGISKGGTIHNFGTIASPRIGDSVLSIAQGYYNLQWADPFGASTNDYDLFMINAAGAVKYSSTTTQSGTQDPYEQFAAGTLATGDRLVVFKAAGAAVRAINVNTNRGTLKVATFGQTHGHSAIPDAYCVAAIPATGVPFLGTNSPESFTSDGPRRLFFDSLGVPLVSGTNYTFASGKYITRLKPDITAADGVSTTLPASTGLNPFFGTSAAAPHAGAIAALLKSAKPTLTPAQVRTILVSTALDLTTTGVGYDNVTGYGVLQAYQAMVNLNPTPAPNIALGTNIITEGSSSNGNGQIDPGELGNLSIQLINSTPSTATNVTATVTTTTPGVTIVKGTYNYGSIAGNSSSANTVSPFVFAVNQSVACGTTITFQVLVTFGGGGPSPAGFIITTTLGTNTFASLSAAIGTPAASNAVFNSTTGQQIGRVSRGGTTSTCAAPVANPGLTITTGARQYDSYVFTNTTGASQCFTTTLNSTTGTSLFTVAYTAAGFVPSNPSTNYLAEPGQSAVTQTYSFTVAAGAKFTVVVHAVDSLSNPGGNELGAAYTLGITYVACMPKTTCTPIIITKATLPAGAIGTPYNQHVTATGGSGAYIDTLSGNLPAGLTFAGDSLSGTPTQAGTFAIVIKVGDPTGCPGASMAYKLFIAGDSATSVTATAGTPQTVLPNATFPTALQVVVKNSNNVPLSGVNVIFSAPITGASGTFTGGVTTVIVVTNASGIATAPTFTANATAGSYTVTATVNNVPPVSFSLANVCPSTVVTTSADSGPGSLRTIIANACPGSTVTFDPSVTTINLTNGEIPITQAVTINGNGANATSISGSNLSRIFLVNDASAAAAISISGLTFKNGKPQATGVGSANSDNGGGAILLSSAGTLTINNCYFLNNDASLTDLGEGGGIDNESAATLTVTNTGFTSNIAPEDGGGIAQWGSKVAIISNCTFTGNTANTDATGNHPDGFGGGIIIANTTGAGTAGGATLTNCTFFGNSGYVGGNIMKYAGTFRLGSSIIGGGILATGAPATNGRDINSNGTTITSNGYNVVQYTGGYTLTTTNNTQGVDPKMLPLANYGGPMPTMLPMSSSVAINGGITTTPTLTVDQRGLARIVGARVDMGAVETNYAATIIAGTPQSTLINTAFPIALQAKVTESGNNIVGDSVLFGAPATGASGTFVSGLKTVTVVTNASGIATAPTFTANGIVGTYTDTASIGAAFTSLKYALTNSFIPLAFTGTCPNINLAIARPGYNTYNNEGVMIYNIDTTTGAATVIAGGPLKDSLTGKNIDVNGAGLNAQDGFLYAMRDTLNGNNMVATLYRIGSNYANTVLGTILPPPLNYGELAMVSPSAGTFDDQGNYYITGFSGYNGSAPNTFLPHTFYIGKIANAASLPYGGNGTIISPTWIQLNTNNVACNSFIYNTIFSFTSSGANAGSFFQDLAYSNVYRSLYMYNIYPAGQGSNTFYGGLMSIVPSTGVVTCYPTTTPMGATNNEVAGLSTTANGGLRVLLTSGDIYKTVAAGNGSYTGAIVKVGASGIPMLGVTGSMRGDLASCATGPSSLPVSPLPSSIAIGAANQIVAYPNPAQGVITISVGQPLNNAAVRLLGIAGNVIAEKSGVSGYTFQMDMSGKPGGMYMVEVIQGGNSQKVKILKTSN